MFYFIELLDVHPFETHMHFSIEMLWTTFAPTQDSSIDPMQSEDIH